MPPGPPPKPRDQRARRNKVGGTTSESVVVPMERSVPWLDEYPGDTIEVEVGDRLVVIPKPPARMLKQTREDWTAFWVAPEASFLRQHHVPALRRLVRLYDDEERLRRRVAKSRMVPRNIPLGMDGEIRPGERPVEWETRAEKLPGHLGIGSQGQIVVSPDFAALMAVRKEIRALEDRFAGTPLAQFKVGWQRASMYVAEQRAVEASELAAAAAKIAERHGKLGEQQ